MSLKNEFVIKINVYIVVMTSLAMAYLAFESEQDILLSLAIINLLLLSIILFFYSKDIKKNFIINSIYDTETKLYNRQYFLAELATTYERSIRYDSSLSILMITIKNLDKCSSKEKNIVLKEIGTSMLMHTRQSDIVCRYDEDKIAMLLPMTDYLHASIAKDRLKNTLLNISFKDVNQPIEFIFTIVQNKKEETADEFLIRCIEETMDLS